MGNSKITHPFGRWPSPVSAQLLAGDKKLIDSVAAGLRLGCEPLLLDQGWSGQAFIGGGQGTPPGGNDINSRDIVLNEK